MSVKSKHTQEQWLTWCNYCYRYRKCD